MLPELELDLPPREPVIAHVDPRPHEHAGAASVVGDVGCVGDDLVLGQQLGDEAAGGDVDVQVLEGLAGGQPASGVDGLCSVPKSGHYSYPHPSPMPPSRTGSPRASSNQCAP